MPYTNPTVFKHRHPTLFGLTLRSACSISFFADIHSLRPRSIEHDGVTGTNSNEAEAYLFYAVDGRVVDAGKAIEHSFSKRTPRMSEGS